jgi:hypothetical protein
VLAVKAACRYWHAIAILHEVLTMHEQVEIALPDPVFNPKRQVSAKFFRWAERLISAIGMD